jgi:hypothetical protein
VPSPRLQVGTLYIFTNVYHPAFLGAGCESGWEGEGRWTCVCVCVCVRVYLCVYVILLLPIAHLLTYSCIHLAF